jgi:hypothetical protein
LHLASSVMSSFHNLVGVWVWVWVRFWFRVRVRARARVRARVGVWVRVQVQLLWVRAQLLPHLGLRVLEPVRLVAHNDAVRVLRLHQREVAEQRLVPVSVWGADPQSRGGLWRAGGWLRSGWGHCPGGEESPRPMAVAWVAAWCCRWRGRPPCQLARGYEISSSPGCRSLWKLLSSEVIY